MSDIAVTIPKAVMDAAEESEAAIEAEMAGGEEAPESQESEPQSEPEDAKPTATAEESEPQVQDEGWMNRYKTLSGKYNAEVPRLHNELKQLREELGFLQASRQERAEPAERVETPKVSLKPGHLRHLKTEEAQEYGDSLLDMNARIARGVAEEVTEQSMSKMQALEQQIQQLTQRIGQTQTTTFWDRVEAQVPGAQSINATDPLWHSFLNETDPVSGMTYRDIGVRAINEGSVSRMTNLFGVFQRAYAAPQSSGSEQGEAEVETVPKPSIKAVGSRRISEAPKTAARNLIKESEVAKFYADLTRGTYKGREKEAAALEEEIEKAASEGRITSG